MTPEEVEQSQQEAISKILHEREQVTAEMEAVLHQCGRKLFTQARKENITPPRLIVAMAFIIAQVFTENDKHRSEEHDQNEWRAMLFSVLELSIRLELALVHAKALGLIDASGNLPHHAVN
jgi:hypothetical protein